VSLRWGTWKEHKVFTAGSIVKPGFYFNRDQLDLVAVGNREGALPGGDGECYSRVPAVLALLLAPILGAGFVVIAPGVRLGRLLYRLGRRSLPAVTFVWQKLPIRSLRRHGEPPPISEARNQAQPAADPAHPDESVAPRDH
jgi:hypothetical protein